MARGERSRTEERARAGGLEDRALRNLFTLYRPLLDTLHFFDNSSDTPRFANGRENIYAMKRSTKSSLTQKAMRALTDAVAKVVEDHRRRARPLAVWRDGKAVWIPAVEAGM